MNIADRLSVALLVGGLGTRLGSITNDLPKPLVPVHGRPFLTYLLDRLLAAGISNVVLCSGYLGESIRASIGDSYQSMRVSYSQERCPLGTGGALRLALPFLSGKYFLVINGDSYCSFDLKNFREWHEAKEARCSILLTRVEDTGRYGRVNVGEDGNVTQFVEKSLGQGSGWINAGAYLVGREIVEDIPTDMKASLENDIFPKIIGKGLFGFEGGDRFLDIGTPESYRLAASFFGAES